MEDWDLEQLRRSVVMIPGSSVGPMTKQAALDLIEELRTSKEQTKRYREIVAQLRRVLDSLET